MPNAVNCGQMRRVAVGFLWTIIAAAVPAVAHSSDGARAESLMREWVAGTLCVSNGPAPAALPQGAQLDRVHSEGPWVGVWLAMLARIVADGPITVADLFGKAQGRHRVLLTRSLGWLGNMGLVTFKGLKAIDW